MNWAGTCSNSAVVTMFTTEGFTKGLKGTVKASFRGDLQRCSAMGKQSLYCIIEGKLLNTAATIIITSVHFCGTKRNTF